MSFDAFRSYARHILRPLGLQDSSAPPPSRRSPALPSSTSPLWTATTHTFVGASNRSVPKAWAVSRFGEDPSGILDDAQYDTAYDPQSANVRETSADLADAQFWLYEREGGDTSATLQDSVPPPIIVVKRYVPAKRARGSGITLLMLSGMGMPKEIYEPLIELILPQLTDAGVAIDEIWSVDMPMSGETALANPPGYLYGNEKDITRDILHFLTAYLPLQPGQDLPEALPYRAPHASNEKQVTRADLHVVGHSLGAQAALLSAVHAPALFASLTIFDPAIVPPGKILDGFSKMPNDIFCTMISERHDSRDALREAVRKNKRLAQWDPRIVETFVARGAVDEPGKGVRLTSPPRLEWALYYDKETPTHTFDRLSDVRVPLLAVMPSRPFATPPKVFQSIFDGLPQSKRLIWVKDASHQIIWEHLDDNAAAIVSWLKDQRASEAKARL